MAGEAPRSAGLRAGSVTPSFDVTRDLAREVSVRFPPQALPPIYFNLLALLGGQRQNPIMFSHHLTQPDGAAII